MYINENRYFISQLYTYGMKITWLAPAICQLIIVRVNTVYYGYISYVGYDITEIVGKGYQ